MSTTYSYVCDECGAVTTADPIPEGEEWTCGECGSHAAWEFTNSTAARDHSAHIRNGLASGLFRRV